MCCYVVIIHCVLMTSLLIQSSLEPTFSVLTRIFVNTTIFRFCPHMLYIHPLVKNLKVDTCQDKIKLQKVFCVCISIIRLTTKQNGLY